MIISLVLNSDETGTPSQNAGFEVERGTEDNVSFLWNETNDRWTTNGKDLTASTFIGNVTGQVSTLSNHDTDDLTEGSTNLYFTNARAREGYHQETQTPVFQYQMEL